MVTACQTSYLVCTTMTTIPVHIMRLSAVPDTLKKCMKKGEANFGFGMAVQAHPGRELLADSGINEK